MLDSRLLTTKDLLTATQTLRTVLLSTTKTLDTIKLLPGGMDLLLDLNMMLPAISPKNSPTASTSLSTLLSPWTPGLATSSTSLTQLNISKSLSMTQLESTETLKLPTNTAPSTSMSNTLTLSCPSSGDTSVKSLSETPCSSSLNTHHTEKNTKLPSTMTTFMKPEEFSDHSGNWSSTLPSKSDYCKLLCIANIT
jgi:hypothetical protein